MVLFSETLAETINHLKPQTWYMSLKTFLIIMTCYIPLKSSWKMLFSGNVFGKQCLYKDIKTYIIIRIWILVILLFYINIVDYYMNTFDDMQSEMDFFYHGNDFEHNQDFEHVFWKSDDAILEYAVLGSNVCLIEIDCIKFLF